MNTAGEQVRKGQSAISYVERWMPLLSLIRERFRTERPFRRMSLAVRLHIESKAAALVRLFSVGGAKVVMVSPDPLSVRTPVVAALQEEGITVLTQFSRLNERVVRHILREAPNIIIDDGAELVAYVHKLQRTDSIIGGCEETTSGVRRLRAMAKRGKLKFPVIAVNDAYTKHLFDNRYGTGQTALEGILRLTGRLMAGKRIVGAGYGWVGRGVSLRSRGLGARVIATEVDAIKAIEALLDGQDVMSLQKAAKLGDFFVTCVGEDKVIRKEHISRMRNGAILCNAGYSKQEIDVRSLRKESVSSRTIRPFVEEYHLGGNNFVDLLANGSLVNIVGAEGHPPEVMDMSFANQALAAKYLVDNSGKLSNDVHRMPMTLDLEVARAKLRTLG